MTPRPVSKLVSQSQPIPVRQLLTPLRRLYQLSLGHLRVGFHQGVAPLAPPPLPLRIAQTHALSWLTSGPLRNSPMRLRSAEPVPPGRPQIFHALENRGGQRFFRAEAELKE